MKLSRCENCNNGYDFNYSFCPFCGKKNKSQDRRPKLRVFGSIEREDIEILKGYATEFVDAFSQDKEVDEDMYQYLMESVVKIFYGEDAFDIMYGRNKK